MNATPSYIVTVRLVNERGDRRRIELEVPLNMTGSAVAAEAIRIANTNLPPEWPAGLDPGTWQLEGFDV